MPSTRESTQTRARPPGLSTRATSLDRGLGHQLDRHRPLLGDHRVDALVREETQVVGADLADLGGVVQSGWPSADRRKSTTSIPGAPPSPPGRPSGRFRRTCRG